MIFNGEKLRELREKKLLTRLDLAKKLGVSDPQVGRWEQGKCMPRPAMIKKIAKALQVAVDELVAIEQPEVSEAT